MNMAVKANMNRKQFTVAINWASQPIEWHLEQYGSWLQLDGNTETFLGAKSMLGQLIDAENGVKVDKRERVPPQCKINDIHADAVADMLTHILQGENIKVKRWLQIVILFYVDFKSESTIAKKLGISEYSVARDKMLGLVRLATKYKFRSRIIGA